MEGLEISHIPKVTREPHVPGPKGNLPVPKRVA